MTEWVLTSCQLSLLLPGMIPYFKYSLPSLNLQPLPSPSSSPQLQFLASPIFQRKWKPRAPTTCCSQPCSILHWGWHSASSHRGLDLSPLPVRKNEPSPIPSPSGTQPLPFVPLHPLILLAVLLKLLPSLKALPPSLVSPQPPFLRASQLSFSVASRPAFFVPLFYQNTRAKATHNPDTANPINVSISPIRHLSSFDSVCHISSAVLSSFDVHSSIRAWFFSHGPVYLPRLPLMKAGVLPGELGPSLLSLDSLL